MLEVWGRGTAIRYADRRIVTTPLRADNDDVALNVAAADLRRIALATTDDDRIAVLLYFRSPALVVNDVTTQHHPVPVFLEPALRDQARTLVRAIATDLLELRRIIRPRPNLAAPRPVPGRTGPVRPDAARAADRMRYSGNVIREITALHAYARPDEYVLEMAQATYSGTPGLVVITSLRLLFISVGITHELPVAALERVEVHSAPGAAATLWIWDGLTDLEFFGWHGADFERFAQATRLVCEMMRVDGSIAPDRPNSVELFGEWQLLMERRQLGMIEDDPFARQAVGILLATQG